MKKLFFVSAIFLIALSACHKKDSAGQTIKLMSYNIHNGIGLDKITDYTRIGELIKSQAPDVVAIQEIDSVTERSNGKYVLGEIAEAADMKGFFAPAIDYRGGKYGIGILTNKDPLEVKRYSMPGTEEARALIVAEFEDYIFACTHLSLTEEDRNASVKIISDLAKNYNKPFFIAGDFNAEPDSYFINSITKEFTPLSGITTPTFPADTPNRVLDYIMFYNPNGKDVESSNEQVIEETVMSDHRPITVSTILP